MAQKNQERPQISQESPSRVTDSQHDAKLKQQKALAHLLFKFSQSAAEVSGDMMKLNELCETQATALANLINAQTTAALMALHVAMKNEVGRILNDAIDASGKEVIEAFKRGHAPSKTKEGQ